MLKGLKNLERVMKIKWESSFNVRIPCIYGMKLMSLEGYKGNSIINVGMRTCQECRYFIWMDDTTVECSHPSGNLMNRNGANL